MPSLRSRQIELERVLGTPALFATAYGNVGSSIYYALGLTAVYALGLTPLVFIIAGVIFALLRTAFALSLGRCDAVVVQAFGSRGTRAQIDIAQTACAPAP